MQFRQVADKRLDDNSTFMQKKMNLLISDTQKVYSCFSRDKIARLFYLLIVRTRLLVALRLAY